MSQTRAILLTGVLLLSAASVAVGPVTGSVPGVVTISTETTPERPAPGEDVTITTRISNPEGGSDAYSLHRIAIRETDADNSTLYASSNREESIEVGETVARDLSVEADERGEQTFVVHIRLVSNGQVRNLERTVTVTVGESDPALSLSAQPVGASGDTTFQLNVSNPRTDAIRGLTVALDSETVDFDEDRRVTSQLESGGAATLQYPASNVSTGPTSVTAQLEYTTADGEFVSTTTELTTTVERVDNPGNVTLSGVDVRNVGNQLQISGQVDNVGGTPVSSVSVAAADESDSLGDVQSRTFVGTMDASASREFGLAVAAPEESGATTIPVRVSYLVDGERIERTLSVAYNPATDSDVSLSGVDIVTRNGEARIVGQANNVGDTNVSALTIAVDGAEYSLGDAQSRTFVGSLSPSATGPFELAVSLPENGESATIPLTLQYRVDGQLVTRSLSVEHRPGTNGDLDLTGVRIDQVGTQLTIRGSTSNLGTANASSVVVSVGDGDAVAPAQSESSYFVGTVQQSEFKSFQVDARLTTETNETISIPVEVSFRVDGQRVTETITVPYTPTTQVAPEQTQRNSAIPIALIGGLLVVLVVGGLGYRRYR